MIDPKSYILSRFPNAVFNSQGKMHVRCPFHDDRHPSFSITEDGLFICGSPKCGVRGNFFQFYKAMESVSWSEVYERLKSPRISASIEAMLGLKKDRQKKLSFNPFPPEPFVGPLVEVDYLTERGLSSDLMDMFGVRYGTGGAADGVNLRNTLVFPIYDYDGTYYTFQARALVKGTSARWKHPKGSCASYLLYAGWMVDNRKPYLWVVEGASDVWKMYAHGEMAVGLFTKAATDRQINVITKLCRTYSLVPIVCLDGDAREAGDHVWGELFVSGLKPKIVYLNVDEDPGSLSVNRFKEVMEGMNAGEKTVQHYDEWTEA